jgi:hypothetical protein
MSNLLIQNGIPEYAVILLLMLPIAITVSVIGRQIIGIKGFGIAIPVFIAYAYLATGLTAGVIIFFAILGIGFIVKFILKNVRLLYLPKMALILIGIIIGILLLLTFIPYLNEIQFPEAIFSFLILIISAEQFASFLIEHGPRKTLNITLETLAIATAIFFLITWQWLRGIVFSYSIFVLIATILINLLLGKWTGLRLSEYIRFKNIISK